MIELLESLGCIALVVWAIGIWPMLLIYVCACAGPGKARITLARSGKVYLVPKLPLILLLTMLWPIALPIQMYQNVAEARRDYDRRESERNGL